MRTRRAIRIAPALLLALGAGALTGALGACNYAGAAAYLIGGPPKVSAQFTLPDAPTAVFIDDRSNHIPQRRLRLALGQEAETLLIEKTRLKQEQVIAFQAALLAASNEQPNELMSIADIGRAVGAETVVYATIDAWTLSRDGVSTSPGAIMRVKVFDVASGERLWPEEPRGFPVTVRLPESTEPMPAERAEIFAMHASLAYRAGRSLAELFYKHEEDPLSGAVND